MRKIHFYPWYTPTGICQRFCVHRAKKGGDIPKQFFYAGLYGGLEVFGLGVFARMVGTQIKANLPQIFAQYKLMFNQALQRRKHAGRK